MSDTGTVCSWWATADDLDEDCLAGLTPAQVAAHLETASGLLYRVSGHRWPGDCEVTVRPQPVAYGGAVVWRVGDGWWVPLGIANTLAVNCLGGGGCSCSCSSEARLDGHVTEVLAVTIDGALLDPVAYRVDEHAILVRQDGGVWPTCQRMDLPDTEPGTWSVSYLHGGMPPPEGRDAAIALAVELAKGCTGGECALPANVVSVARRGVAYEIEPGDLLSEGRTGIFAVDLFLRAVNPHSLTVGARVRSPDRPRPRAYGSSDLVS